MEEIINESGSWLQNNQALLIEYAVNIAAAALILFFGFIAAGMVAGGIRKVMSSKGLDKTIVDFVAGLIRYGIIAFVIIAALGRVGVQTASFVAIIGAAGLAIGLALQGSLSNFASGVLLILFRPFKAGDYVEIAGTAGAVDSIQIFSTVLTTPDNKVVVVPNAAVFGGNIVNYSRLPTRRVDMVIGVSYKADLKQTQEVLTRIVTAHEKVLKDPAPTIEVVALADSSVNFVVRPWVNTADYWGVYFDLHKQIKIGLDEAGIEIPFPQMDVHLNKVA
ncbi:small-conductance mechanosensitive channel MscS [Motilimonas eburnea]|uniref:small-conductance mechanosensitive channel MscS n=1 Tax=Motilimonas eburnea TaxID=1737488 RepID=UPI001E437A4F|nr:small-conductance mechanosensitive channel MscS [Motilimonas eburnea]MCE2572647.1 small-conductance mechanosensitive channel MscS [Motilimonas eburnea]